MSADVGSTAQDTVSPEAGTARPEVRIGTAERTAATKALDAHLEAGRLDAEEYGTRVAEVSVARTRSEIEPLFADLPAPGPAWTTSTSRAQASAPTAARPPAGSPGNEIGQRMGWLLGASSTLATIAFFVLLACGVSMAWLAFLAVPLISALVAGDPKAHKHYRRQQRARYRC